MSILAYIFLEIIDSISEMCMKFRAFQKKMSILKGLAFQNTIR